MKMCLRVVEKCILGVIVNVTLTLALLRMKEEDDRDTPPAPVNLTLTLNQRKAEYIVLRYIMCVQFLCTPIIIFYF